MIFTLQLISNTWIFYRKHIERLARSRTNGTKRHEILSPLELEPTPKLESTLLSRKNQKLNFSQQHPPSISYIQQKAPASSVNIMRIKTKINLKIYP